MEEIIRVKDQYYILATSSLTDDRTRVLKHGETFAIFDRSGDIQPVGQGEQGIYHEGTRFLSRLELRLGSIRPLLLSSTVKEDNSLIAVDLTNPDIFRNGEVVLPHGALHIFRAKFLWQGVYYERLRFSNYSASSVDLSFSLSFEGDFADIFEVRGIRRAQRGSLHKQVVDKAQVVLTYTGLDGSTRQTRISCSPAPQELSSDTFQYTLPLKPKEVKTFSLTIACEAPGITPPLRLSYEQAFTKAERALKTARNQYCDLYTSNEQFNDWVNRSLADLQMMITDTEVGPYPYAGVPWFSTVFGRDGIITALETLWINPEIAKGVLAYLASTQAQEVIPEQDAEPGKILHEMRKGEMAALGEVPFGRYYGTVDATPLFVILAGYYYRQTEDLSFIKSIWPNIELALQWIDMYGDLDGDGFVEYARRSSKGLVHQGWKDSQDSVFHADGRLAEGPIALCEVQSYVYGAKCQAAELARALDQPAKGEIFRQQAHQLQERFEQTFWCEELSTYALALDGQKRPCLVQSSNAGHCLFTGIASHEHAWTTAQTLLDTKSFSGWGIRTIAASAARYNPMSYHNGSIWPHDNALIAYGLAQYGFKKGVLKILSGLFDATLFLDLHRLPELFCGFHRRPGEGPTLYPVACAPQSWAVASVFWLLQACLGLTMEASQMRICFSHPILPEFLQWVRIKNLRLGKAVVDLILERHKQDVSIHILRKEGEVEIVIVK